VAAGAPGHHDGRHRVHRADGADAGRLPVAVWFDLADRVVLGTDFPNIPYPYRTQLDALAGLDLGDAWLRKVCWHNGIRLLGARSGRQRHRRAVACRTCEECPAAVSG
jgi:hypothetical protein